MTKLCKNILYRKDPIFSGTKPLHRLAGLSELIQSGICRNEEGPKSVIAAGKNPDIQELKNGNRTGIIVHGKMRIMR